MQRGIAIDLDMLQPAIGSVLRERKSRVRPADVTDQSQPTHSQLHHLEIRSRTTNAGHPMHTLAPIGANSTPIYTRRKRPGGFQRGESLHRWRATAEPWWRKGNLKGKFMAIAAP